MLIGLVGRRGTGKDTIANHLVTSHCFRNRKFSAPLKEALKALFGLTDEHIEGPLKEIVHPLWGVSPRSMMQFFGTEIMQNRLQDLIPCIGRSHAVHRMMMDIEEDNDTGRIVISDVRFQHEVDALLERGAFLVRVTREGHVVRDGTVDMHESEAGVDELFTHAEIKNDEGLITLLHRVECLIWDRLHGSGV